MYLTENRPSSITKAQADNIIKDFARSGDLRFRRGGTAELKGLAKYEFDEVHSHSLMPDTKKGPDGLKGDDVYEIKGTVNIDYLTGKTSYKGAPQQFKGTLTRIGSSLQGKKWEFTNPQAVMEFLEEKTFTLAVDWISSSKLTSGQKQNIRQAFLEEANGILNGIIDKDLKNDLKLELADFVNDINRFKIKEL